MADHMAAMLHAERAHAAAAAARTAAATGLAARVQTAVLALIAARDPLDCITHEWPGLLGLDAVSVCAEVAPNGAPEGALLGARPLPPGTVQRLMGSAPALVRPGVADPLLHGEAAALARMEALVVVPFAEPVLLAIACRDGRALTPDGTGSLAFLGRALAAVLLARA